jgi:LPXTG-site transpeptidase (sortase) family protein
MAAPRGPRSRLIDLPSMRLVLRVVGSLLMGVSVLGLVGLGAFAIGPHATATRDAMNTTEASATAKDSGTHARANDSGALTTSNDSGAHATAKGSGALTTSNDSGTHATAKDSGALTTSNDSGAHATANDSGAHATSNDSSAHTPAAALAAPLEAITAWLREVASSTLAQPTQMQASAPGTDLGAQPERPITHVTILSIGLDADVVDAALVSIDGGLTWQVPAFKVGHAESTAGAGQVGNAILLGHVTSLHSGNVFADLDRVRVGDTIRLFSTDQQFDYVVNSTQAVPRTDSSVVQPTPEPSVSLITCTGLWLPTIWDYTDRLVVHAELSQ